MNQCLECRTEFPEDGSFCPKCGRPVEIPGSDVEDLETAPAEDAEPMSRSVSPAEDALLEAEPSPPPGDSPLGLSVEEAAPSELPRSVSTHGHYAHLLRTIEETVPWNGILLAMIFGFLLATYLF
jgi:hypothetical protein